jgi:hypothetical protein
MLGSKALRQTLFRTEREFLAHSLGVTVDDIHGASPGRASG